MKRRSMIKNAALLAGGAVLTGCDTNMQSSQSLNNLFVHHVLFWLKEPNNPQACAEFEAGLKKLLEIDLIVDKHIGKPAATNRDVIENTYTYSMIACFKNKADQDAYQPHPQHQEFIKNCEHLWNRVMVIDSEAAI